MTRISAIVVSHNHGPFLSEALGSLEAQTRRPDEIVLIDDGSVDDSWPIIENFAYGRGDARLLRHDRATGAATTFNDGIQASTGDLIVILSGDDRLSPNYLEELERALHEKGWAFAYADSHRFGTDSRILRFPDFSLSRLARGNYINASAMFKRTVYESIGGWDPRFDAVGYDDWDFWLRAAAAGFRGGHVAACHLEWRQHPGNRTSAQTKRDVLAARLLIGRKHSWSVRFWMLVGVLRRAALAPARAVAAPRRPGAT